MSFTPPESAGPIYNGKSILMGKGFGMFISFESVDPALLAFLSVPEFLMFF